MSTEEAAVRPIEVTPEAPRVIPEVKVPATRPEAEPKPPVEVKKAKSGTIRLTDTDTEDDELLDVGNIVDVGKK